MITTRLRLNPFEIRAGLKLRQSGGYILIKGS